MVNRHDSCTEKKKNFFSSLKEEEKLVGLEYLVGVTFPLPSCFYIKSFIWCIFGRHFFFRFVFPPWYLGEEFPPTIYSVAILPHL